MSADLYPYLPRLIRYWEQDAPGQQHRCIEGSMVFVDISGFTKMSERLARHGKVGAEEVTEVIDNTFGRLLPAAYAYGASLLKFGGDALLLLFTDDGHALRACAAAVEMRRQLREIGTFGTTAGKVTLRMSVGIHSGLFDFFLVGGSHRELIVAGPAATATVAMESAATAGQILISPATAAALPARNVGVTSGPGSLLRGQVEAEVLGFTPAPTAGSDLAHFIPPALRNVLQAGEVDPEHRPAAVAFVHFRDLDDLLARDGPELTTTNLDELVSTVQRAADRYEITFLATDIASGGGKIILTAGVPVAAGNDEEQMLLALRQIAVFASPFPVSIGVNWGPVFAGPVGLSFRRTYTVMGDTVNLAARLMAKAPPGEVYSTAALLDGSRTIFTFTTPEPFHVKGKKLPIQAFSIGEPEGSKAGQGAQGVPLIGRESELAEMLAVWETAQTGQGRVVEVAAEAGIGKSRLLEEFLITAHPSRVVRAECRLYQSTTPYFPFRTLLRTAWGLEGQDPEATEASLRKLVAAVAPALEPWLALIGIPLGLNIEESDDVAQLEDQFRPARTLAAVGALLEATETEPTLFVIEDTHWMDDASAALLGGLLSGHERLPWLFLLTRRPGSDGFVAPDAPWGTVIDLQPLGAEHARQFIKSATADAPLLPQQVDLLAERAAGSPLFLIELLAALRSGGNVDTLPHSVEGMIGARIDKLPAPDRNLLRRLAVLGSGFRGAHIGAVLRENESAPRWQRRALSRLDEFLSRGDADWLQFRHALIRDVAYEGLPFKTRLELHARVGDSIARAAGEHPESQAELLSLHYSHARKWKEAWRFSRIAGNGARQVYANLPAAEFYRRALAAARYVDEVTDDQKATVAEALGDVLEQAGLFEESLQAYKQATTLVGNDPIRRADLLLKRARARARVGAYSVAFREIAIGCRMVTEVGTKDAWRARSRLTALSAQLRQLQEHPRAALKLAQQARREAEDSGEKEALARAYQVLDAAYNMLGQPSKATYGERALQIYEGLGDLLGIATVTNNLGGQAYFEGRWDDALEYYTRAQDAFRRAGNESEAAVSGANIGEVLVSQGRLEQAEEVLKESVQTLRAHNLVDAAIFAEIQLARLQLARGDPEAMPTLEEIRREAAEVGQTHSALEAAIYIALGLVEQARYAEALELVAQAERAAGREAELYGCPLARVRTIALARLGQTDEARVEADKGLRLARDEGLVYEEALLLRAQAEISEGEHRQNQLEEAQRLLQQLGVIRAA
ncbi:MAG TPA: adenylate/guanylate cyclase domain-containing protein [Acidimicrobiia bacterium]|nr:adenylate/guanylate cyclase domain-containing protein [Acidimicrobiia bacterium]